MPISEVNFSVRMLLFVIRHLMNAFQEKKGNVVLKAHYILSVLAAGTSIKSANSAKIYFHKDYSRDTEMTAKRIVREVSRGSRI